MKKEKEETRGRGWRETWEAREKKYAELFGMHAPKGKVLSPEGELITPAAATTAGMCLLQYPPKTGRLTWVYATHGLSQMPAADSAAPTQLELIVHWKMKDKAALRVLAHAADYIVQHGAVEPGQIIAGEARTEAGAEMYRHALAVKPEGHVHHRGDRFDLMLLVGISEAEMEFAMRVKPEIADGRMVLLEALRLGGVFPVTDPTRTCLTRRRDFNRIWEGAFRLVRERAAKQ